MKWLFWLVTLPLVVAGIILLSAFGTVCKICRLHTTWLRVGFWVERGFNPWYSRNIPD